MFKRRSEKSGAPSTLLVGRAKTKEIIWKDLSEKHKIEYRAAMSKEWSKWTQFRATIPCPKSRLDKYPDDLKIIGTRWVLTRKGDGTAKARLVVQGCQEKTHDVRADAPTGSREAVMLVLVFRQPNRLGAVSMGC